MTIPTVKLVVLLVRVENNVFRKLEAYMDKSLVGVRCAAHIVHNTVQTATDYLPIDVETVVVKMYSYIYTVIIRNLQEFCKFASVEYRRLLGYSKARLLALLPALERILLLFEPLKSYFLSLEKCPALIENFFSDPFAKAWLCSLQN